MYNDAGYGDNWQPEGNNARRLDPYTRSCTILISLFAIGFVLIVIIVLSLIPIYITREPEQTSTSIQTTRISVTNYNIHLQSSTDIFDPNIVLSDITNRIALQAALTSMLQKDSLTIGSIVEINSPISKQISSRIHRQRSNLYNIEFNLNITYQKICTSICANQYQTRVEELLSNRTSSFVRYKKTDNSSIHWFTYQLPSIINSYISLISVDPKTINSALNTLMSINNIENQPIIENSTSMLVG